MSQRRDRPRKTRREDARRGEARRHVRPARGGGPPPLVPVLVTLGILAAVVVVFLLLRGGKPAEPVPSPAAGASVVADITSLPVSLLDQVALGDASNKLKPMPGEAPLRSGGKPEVLYLGAEYCPYCASERWPLIIALSRFGTFTGLQETLSSPTDVYANTPTFSFAKAKYQSAYLVFTGVEAEDRYGNALQTPTAAQVALEQKYAGGIPFLDFGNRLFFSGATYLPSTLEGLNWERIAAAIKDPSTPQAKGILGSANLITAAVCQVTGQQPAAVCSDPVVQGIGRGLPGS